jgi:hypothetical protein
MSNGWSKLTIHEKSSIFILFHGLWGKNKSWTIWDSDWNGTPSLN